MKTIPYKLDIFFTVLFFIAAFTTDNEITATASVMLAVMIILYRDIKMHIDKKDNQ